MKLGAKFSLFILVLLIFSGTLSFFVFHQVLSPEFERQKEESWMFRAQSVTQKVSQTFKEGLLTAKWIVRLVPEDGVIPGLGLELFQNSDLDQLIILKKSDWANQSQKPLVTLFRRQSYAAPAMSLVEAFEFKVSDKHIWMGALINDYAVFLAVHQSKIIENTSDFPLSFLFNKSDGKLILSSNEQLKLSTEAQKILETKIGLDVIQSDSHNKDRLLVTSVLKDFPIGVGIYGANIQIDQTWKQLTKQYLGTLLLFAGFSLVLSAYFSSLITKKLTYIAQQSQVFGQGQFDIILEETGRDEVSDLSRSMNIMVRQIKDLFIAREEQLRMQSELELAQTVQGTLFPPAQIETKNYEVAGYYRSASECGGDLWGYWEGDDYLYFFILDATGHGVPAALITSATRAVAAIFETQKDLNIVSIANAMNYAIAKVGNNLQQATSFLCQIHKLTGKMEYVNASHVSAYVFPSEINQSTKVKELPMLSDPVSVRLGEKINPQIKSGHYTVNEGESVVLITDGFFDLQMGDGKTWQEKRLLKRMIDTFSKKSGASFSVQISTFIGDIVSEHGDNSFKDDVTLVAFKRKKITS